MGKITNNIYLSHYFTSKLKASLKQNYQCRSLEVQPFIYLSHTMYRIIADTDQISVNERDKNLCSYIEELQITQFQNKLSSDMLL